MSSLVQPQLFGKWRRVFLEVAAWDAAHAEVDLSAACMFTHELSDAGFKGGLLHLDQALSGSLSALRRNRGFRGDFMETLLVSRPQAMVKANSILMIGLGDPSSWTAEATARAVATAVRIAAQRGDHCMAFAPSLLDSGLSPAQTSGVALSMVGAAIEAIEAQRRIAECGLGGASVLRRIVFDVGASRVDAALEYFRVSFQNIASYVTARV